VGCDGSARGLQVAFAMCNRSSTRARAGTRPQDARMSALFGLMIAQAYGTAGRFLQSLSIQYSFCARAQHAS
jgi:hypothetical protein